MDTFMLFFSMMETVKSPQQSAVNIAPWVRDMFLWGFCKRISNHHDTDIDENRCNYLYRDDL
jgi:hypothetical protein